MHTHTHVRAHTHMPVGEAIRLLTNNIYIYIYMRICIYIYICSYDNGRGLSVICPGYLIIDYGVATVSMIDKIIGLFCRILSLS